MAFVGAVFFAYVSKLIPLAFCVGIAMIFCMLKNRVTKLDPKNPEGGQVNTPLTRSVSITSSASRISRISNRLNPTRISEVFNSSGSIKQIPEEVDFATIKTTFLSSIEDPDNKRQYHDLLAICFMVLYTKQDKMPEYLNERSWASKKLVEPYLAYKLDQEAKKGTDAVIQLEIKDQNLKTGGKHYDLSKLKEDQFILTQAAPSEIMQIVQELYSQRSEKESNRKEKAHFSDNAVHAEKYAKEFKTFEDSRSPIAENLSQVG